MSRPQRAALAAETVAILERGAYTAPGGQSVSIADALRNACAATRLYTPDALPVPPVSPGLTPGVEITDETTLAAGRRLVAAGHSVACLNFASAKNPGGGFLGGSQAQEESLARSSGLYATLQTQPAYYEFHRRQRSALYSDHMIVSPAVPVFRDDAGTLLEQPWPCTFLTSAAPNAGAIRQNEPAQTPAIGPALRRRTEAVLNVLAANGCQTIVLGAWGCGVFRNDPAQVAATFREVLALPSLVGQFAQVVFAVYDPAAHQPTLAAFRQAFA